VAGARERYFAPETAIRRGEIRIAVIVMQFPIHFVSSGFRFAQDAVPDLPDLGESVRGKLRSVRDPEGSGFRKLNFASLKMEDWSIVD